MKCYSNTLKAQKNIEWFVINKNIINWHRFIENSTSKLSKNQKSKGSKKS